MKVLAFMMTPNSGLLPTKEDVDRYMTDQVFHQKILLQSMSGIRLRQAFGPYFNEIWWDNVDPRGTGVDIRHIDRVIAEQRPDLVLTFGKYADEPVNKSVMVIRLKCMSCHHPNARFKSQADLDNFAQGVRTWIAVQEREAD